MKNFARVAGNPHPIRVHMTEKEILRRAIRAAQALTLGGMVAATAACDEEVPAPGDSTDTAEDTAADGATTEAISATDTGGVDTPTPDVEADLSPADTGEDAVEDASEDAEPDVEADASSDADPDAEPDALIDASPDADPDVDPDTPEPDVSEPDVERDAPGPDTDEATCTTEPDTICPDACTQDNDADCCNEIEWCFWDPGFGCACAVPGPFVPPTMAA